MQIKTVKNNEEIEILVEGKSIEKYSTSKQINFAGLVEFLMKDELTNVFEFVDETNTDIANEKQLLKLIQTIIGNYNEKVEDYKNFVKAQQGSESGA